MLQVLLNILPVICDETIILHIVVDNNGCLQKVTLFGLGHDAMKWWIYVILKAAFFPSSLLFVEASENVLCFFNFCCNVLL